MSYSVYKSYIRHRYIHIKNRYKIIPPSRLLSHEGRTASSPPADASADGGTAVAASCCARIT